ncbi:hypothetical protein [Holophaga foetida]|uniref:hypothetical protein n=1 Tax=Holophaga foetida TaxID=35839 RepID=UPI0002471C36|nr:hypothetical protein [Holophaga foetida]
MIPILLLPALVQSTPAQPPATLRAQYGWGYAGADGEGQGTLAILLDPASGRLVLELHGLGERLALVTGERSTGYRVQIPRQNIDQTAPDLAALPLPFLPNLGGVEGLSRLLTQGEGPGVKVTKRDKLGPKKMKYAGKDEKGKEVLVWLNRQRWETQP